AARDLSRRPRLRRARRARRGGEDRGLGRQRRDLRGGADQPRARAPRLDPDHPEPLPPEAAGQGAPRRGGQGRGGHRPRAARLRSADRKVLPVQPLRRERPSQLQPSRRGLRPGRDLLRRGVRDGAHGRGTARGGARREDAARGGEPALDPRAARRHRRHPRCQQRRAGPPQRRRRQHEHRRAAGSARTLRRRRARHLRRAAAREHPPPLVTAPAAVPPSAPPPRRHAETRHRRRPSAPGADMTRPNIVFIMSDDHAAHSISAYGSRVNTTPHMDRLADEGARMDATYCTNAICTPSRASILSGTYSHINRAPSIYSEFDYRVRTFPEVLQECGYQTALYGKWHLGRSERSLPRGFDDFRIYPDQGDYIDPVMIGPAGEEQIPGYATDIVTRQSLDFIDRRDPEHPFCLLVHHKAPHRPWIPHPRYEHLYEAGTIPEPETMWDDHATRSEVVREVAMNLDDLRPTDYKDELPAELEGETEEARRARASWKYQ